MLEVKDYGVGITEENRKLIFESNVTTYETMDYATKKPYDFNAGGKGFDLLRMKIFSERYHFKIGMDSRRCAFIFPRTTTFAPATSPDADIAVPSTIVSSRAGRP